MGGWNADGVPRDERRAQERRPCGVREDGFGAHLTKLEPMPDGLSLPLPLQITHGDSTPTVSVPAHAAQAIDVFRMFGIKEGVIELQGTNKKIHLTKRVYTFTVKAYLEPQSIVHAAPLSPRPKFSDRPIRSETWRRVSIHAR